MLLLSLLSFLFVLWRDPFKYFDVVSRLGSEFGDDEALVGQLTDAAEKAVQEAKTETGGAVPASKAKAKAKSKKAGNVAEAKQALDADWEKHLLPEEAHDISVSVPCVLFLYLVG